MIRVRSEASWSKTFSLAISGSSLAEARLLSKRVKAVLFYSPLASQLTLANNTKESNDEWLVLVHVMRKLADITSKL